MDRVKDFLPLLDIVLPPGKHSKKKWTWHFWSPALSVYHSTSVIIILTVDT